MADKLHLTEEDVSYRKMIAMDIKRFLQPFYPYCTVEIFGSSFNGFGFKDCDLDLLFLPFPEYCNLVSFNRIEVCKTTFLYPYLNS